MKKMLVILVLLLINLPLLFAPSGGFILMISPSPITYTYSPQDCLKAIVWVESGNDGSGAYNRNEPQAVGKLQEWPIMVKDVNRILGYNKYTLADRLDDKKSEEMFWIYQNHYNPEMDLDKMARIWCGGPDGHTQDCTLDYLSLVKTRLINS